MSKSILIFLICSGFQSVFGQNLDQSNLELRASNHISEMRIYNLTLDEKDSTLSHVLFFNEDGKTIRENRFSEHEELLISHVYHYDSTGFMERYQVFAGNNELRGERDYSKTENDSLKKQYESNEPSKFSELDSEGNIIAVYNIIEGVKTLKATFVYDTLGRIMEHKVFIIGKYYIPNSSNL